MNCFKTTISIGFAAVMATSAHAITIEPGGFGFTSGVTLGNTAQDPVARPYLAGGVANDNLIAFDYDPTPVTTFNNVGGNIQNRVLTNDDGNLIFMPRIRDTYNIDGGTFSILGFELEGYGGVSTDVDFRLDGLGDKGFSSVSRSDDGEVLRALYADRIFVDAINPPGRQETSYFPAIVTDATAYDFSGSMTLFAEILPLGAVDGSDSVAGNIFEIKIDGIVAPLLKEVEKIPPVPLPAPAIMLMSGLGLLGFWGRKRRKS